MNKNTVCALFKRATDARIRELSNAKWNAGNEIRKTSKVKSLDSHIDKLTRERDKIIDAYVKPRKAKAEAEKKAFVEKVRDLNTKLGFAITTQEKASAIAAIKDLLKTLPNCPEAKLL